MKITALDTIRLAEYPNLIWVLVRTDEGLTGLGETFFGAQAVESYIHESAASYLLGQDPLRIDRHSRDMVGYVGFRSSGVETRGNSAVDIALWDLLGQASGQPIYQLLGGLPATKSASTTPVPDTATSASGRCRRSTTGDCLPRVPKQGLTRTSTPF